MTVALYARGNETSRARQLAECEAWCAAHYPDQDTDVYEDHGGRYPALARLVVGLEAGTITAAITADTITLMRAPMYELSQRGPRRAWLHGVHGGDFDLSTSDDRIAVAMFAASVAIRAAGGEP